jgi:hypothetical protein
MIYCLYKYSYPYIDNLACLSTASYNRYSIQTLIIESKHIKNPIDLYRISRLVKQYDLRNDFNLFFNNI